MAAQALPWYWPLNARPGGWPSALAALLISGWPVACAVGSADTVGLAIAGPAGAAAAPSSVPRPPDSGSAPGRAPEVDAATDRAAIEARWSSAQQRCARHPVAAVRKQCLTEARREYAEALARLR